jgi:hypothetical protein
VVSTTPRPLYPWEIPGTHCTGGWVGPRAGLDVCEKSRPHQDSIPGPSRQLHICNFIHGHVCETEIPAELYVRLLLMLIYILSYPVLLSSLLEDCLMTEMCWRHKEVIMCNVCTLMFSEWPSADQIVWKSILIM